MFSQNSKKKGDITVDKEQKEQKELKKPPDTGRQESESTG